MNNKTYTMLIRQETIYRHTAEGLSKQELTEAFERGDVKFTEGRIVDMTSEIEEITEINK